MSSSLHNIIQEAFQADGAALQDALELRDLDGWDSLSHMVFITSLESEYEIELSGDDIVDMRTIANVREILKTKHGVEA